METWRGERRFGQGAMETKEGREGESEKKRNMLGGGVCCSTLVLMESSLNLSRYSDAGPTTDFATTDCPSSPSSLSATNPLGLRRAGGNFVSKTCFGGEFLSAGAPYHEPLKASANFEEMSSPTCVSGPSRWGKGERRKCAGVNEKALQIVGEDTPLLWPRGMEWGCSEGEGK